MEMICINCPVGCRMNVQIEGKKVQVTGNACPRGESYAKKECTNPTRIVTTSVFVKGGSLEVVSVKTQKDVPKNKIFEILNCLKGVRVKAPIQIGDIIIENIAETGIHVVATKEVEKRGLE